MVNNPEIVSQRINRFSKRELLARLVPNLDLVPSTPIESLSTPISRRGSLQFLTAFLIGGGVGLSRDNIVWAGKNKGNTKNRSGSGDTSEEKAKRQAKKGQEGRKNDKHKGDNKSHSFEEDQKRCAQGEERTSSGCAILPPPGRTR